MPENEAGLIEKVACKWLHFVGCKWTAIKFKSK